MRLRVIDYRPHTGGGSRFFIQLLKALHDSGRLSHLELVSHGEAIERMRVLCATYGVRAKLIDLPYRNRVPGADVSGYGVPLEALEECDVAWLPWVHHHHLPDSAGKCVVGSFHDALMFTEPALTGRYPAAAEREREITRKWLASPAAIVCSSRFSIDVLTGLFACAPARLDLVTLSGKHACATDAGGQPVAVSAPPSRPWLAAPFVLCPANISWHKNHEVLLEGYAQANLAWPLVLTGSGSDLVNHLSLPMQALRRVAVAVGLRPPHRAGVLRQLARRLQLTPGKSLIPLGNLSDTQYDAVLERAACVVMPTLGEGGGSFPVEEAVARGIPVICSDIPVLREHMARLGAAVSWFDPRQPQALAAQLRALVADYSAVRAVAMAQVPQLRIRSWADVAADYLQVFRAASASGARSVSGAA